MSGQEEPVLGYKDLLVGVVGGELFFYVLDIQGAMLQNY